MDVEELCTVFATFLTKYFCKICQQYKCPTGSFVRNYRQFSLSIPQGYYQHLQNVKVNYLSTDTRLANSLK